MKIKVVGKISIIMVALFITSHVASGTTIDQARAFISKNRICELAIGYVAKPIDSVLYVEGALCISDLVFNKGTIHEISGCSLSIYDMKKNSHSNPRPWNWEDAPPTIASKQCASGGFEDLLAKKVLMSCGGETVLSALACPAAVTLPYSTLTPIIIYSSSDRYTKAFNQSVKEKEAQKKKKESDVAMSKATTKEENKRKQTTALVDSKKYRDEFFALRLDTASGSALAKSLKNKRDLYEDFIMTLDNDPSRQCWFFDEAKGLENIDSQIKEEREIQLKDEFVSFNHFHNMLRNEAIKKYRESIKTKEICQIDAQKALDEMLSQDILPYNDYTRSRDETVFSNWLPRTDRQPGHICIWDRKGRNCNFIEYITQEKLRAKEKDSKNPKKN